VIPFYLLGERTRRDFIDVRSKMWLDHIRTYSKIKNHGAPTGSVEIDYAAGHLDVIDRKFGALLTIQSLIGFVISVTVGAFKERLFHLLAVPKDKLLYTIVVLFVGFIVSAWTGMTLKSMNKVFATGLVIAVSLFYLRFRLPDYLAAGLIACLSWLWFTATLMCLRGTGRARWGEMRSIGNDPVTAEMSREAKTQHDYQVMTLIRALVGRTAIYRAAVLLVFTNLYFLVLTGYVTALVLAKDQRTIPGLQESRVSQRQAEMEFQIPFASGDTCDTSPTAASDIGRIAIEVAKHDPIGLLIIGSTDAVPLKGVLREALGNNATLAMTRAECVSGRIMKILRLNNKALPIEVITRAARDQSSEARSKGRDDDRIVEVHLIRPVV